MIIKPFLKWQGGKSKLVEYVDKAFEGPAEDYVEPFLGGGAVFFYRQSIGNIKGTAYLSDLNWKLITTYRTLQKYSAELITKLASISSIPLSEETYYPLRKEFNSFSIRDINSKNEMIRLSVLFIWLNKACFNGLYRENKSGEFNVPIGRYQKVALPDNEHLMACSNCLQNAELHYENIFNIIPWTIANCQIYLDPPYVPLSATASFTSYNAEDFTWKDQQRLTQLAIEFSKQNSIVVISNHGTDLIKSELYPSPPFEYIEEISLQRAGGAKKSGLMATELIVRIK